MYVKATTTDQVKSGRGLGVQLNQLLVGIYNVDGEYFAIDDVCPHMGGALHHGWLDECVVSCPLHMWEFDVKTGKSVWPDDVDLASYPVKVEGDDILVDIDSPQKNEDKA
ncbi:MAG: Rieske 2Fe-2S domain-containing protein [Candidatus Poribacteria bacterium]|jgi:nitrite reductase/ring-hydroxylating ferredoxin subunit|nr:Rieske 2Fe-2S domain-containing protein [Candidatus Poribacteria bacterium]MDP6749482.1 Rieske 2Fe-2S domain-containing protein [Candidatus Poribacteria bacterium]MDP7280978.1 Rieske 2Fe-2S domain-containing protein [Candidatus Poribacteria bacterium]